MGKAETIIRNAFYRASGLHRLDERGLTLSDGAIDAAFTPSLTALCLTAAAVVAASLATGRANMALDIAMVGSGISLLWPLGALQLSTAWAARRHDVLSLQDQASNAAQQSKPGPR